MVNGTAVGIDSTSFITTLLSNGDVVTCIYTLTNSCIGTVVTNSDSIAMSVLSGLSIDEENEESSTLTIYPNPVSETANINYTLTEKGNFLLEIVDLVGHPIKILVQGQEEIGKHFYLFNNDDCKLAPGMYFVRIHFNNKMYAEKMVLIKEQ
jgi:hypothetical protein